MQLARSLLERDYLDAKVLVGKTTNSLSLKEGNIFRWILEISGARQTIWDGLMYDVEIHFSRRHPFEPPAVFFSKTSRNFKNPRHHLVDPTGRVRLESLSLDVWLPTTDGKTLISWISELFSRSTPFATHTACGPSEDPFSRLSREVIRGIAGFLTPAELGMLGATNKTLLAVAHSEPLWAMYYCRGCPAPLALHRLARDMGPLRVFAENGLWYWKGGREAFIRAIEMRRVHRAPVPVECMSLHTYAWREAAGLSVMLDLLQQEAANAGGHRQVFFDRLLSAFKARREALCRVVGWEVKSQDVGRQLLARLDRLHRTFMNSGFTADTIIEAVFRHGLLQFAFDDLRSESTHASLLEPPRQRPADSPEVEPPTLADFLHAWGGLVNVVMRSFRTFEAGQPLDVFDCEGQWLSATVLPISRHTSRPFFDARVLHREIARDGLSLQSLFRLQALNASAAPWDTTLVANDAAEPRPEGARGKERLPPPIPAMGPFGGEVVGAEPGDDEGEGEEAAAELHQQPEQVNDAPMAVDAPPPPPQQQHQPLQPEPQPLQHQHQAAPQQEPPQQQEDGGPLRDRVRRASSLMVHFDGHRATFNEWVPWTCDRTMPYRTRSQRPITLAAEAVREMVKDLNHDENCFLARPDAMEIRLQSFWVDSTQAGGQMRYLVPRSMTVEQIKDDFCSLFGLDASKAVLARAHGRYSPDVRRPLVHVDELDASLTLEQAGVQPRDFVEVALKGPLSSCMASSSLS